MSENTEVRYSKSELLKHFVSTSIDKVAVFNEGMKELDCITQS